jgi:putative heme-binding domain-containing protein
VGVAAHLKPRGLADSLGELLNDPAPRVAAAALDALVEIQDIRSLREILCGDRFVPDVRAATAARLIDSTSGALVLLRLIDENQLPKALRQSVIARAAAHPDSNIRVLYEKFVPEAQRPKKLGQAVSSEAILALEGDANRGRGIFNKSSAAQCKTCHAVQGFGGSLGPDLTHVGKKYERGALLETIIEPSKAIAPEFVPYVLETTSGVVHAGFLVERTENYVMLKDVKSRLVRVPTKEIEVLQAQPKSLMPELILSEITAQDAADLLAFLTTLK